jgi:hypothetical protein
MSDTETTGGTRWSRPTFAALPASVTDVARACIGLSVLSLATLLGHASAQPSPLKAQVIWVRDERVYIASPESLVLEPGDLLTFLLRGKKIATGEVTGVPERELALATLTSGSLKGAKKLESLQVLAQRPPLRAVPVLRVGYPAGDRLNLLFACDPMRLLPRAPGNAYRTEALSERSYRLVRDSTALMTLGRLRGAGAAWPDTLLIRLFDEAADEEIALERGELDAAVFWPGELSAHIREQPRWRDHLSGMRAQGVLAAIQLTTNKRENGVLPILDGATLDSLNEELFRGDLVRWEKAADWPAESGSRRNARSGDPSRIEVDPACPGREVLERVFNRSAGLRAHQDRPPAARVFYLDAPIRQLDSLALGVTGYIRRGVFPSELRARADSLEAGIRRLGIASDPSASDGLRRELRDSLHVELLFAIRCPVVCAPALRPYVNALGADALVNALECRVIRREP